MSARKPKFKVGQVVTYNKERYRYCHRPYFYLVRFDEGGTLPAWYTSVGYSLEKNMRPLTVRERGRA